VMGARLDDEPASDDLLTDMFPKASHWAGSVPRDLDGQFQRMPR
jgi:hypothetical protein